MAKASSASKHMMTIAKHLPKDNFSLTICFLRSNDDKGNSLELDNWEINYFVARFRFKRFREFIPFLKAQRELLRNGPFDIQHSYDFSSLPTEAMFARLFGRKYIYQQRNLSQGGNKLLHKARLLLSTHIIANSYNVKSHLVSTYNIPESKISVVQSGIELDDYNYIGESGGTLNPYIISVGHIHPMKRHEDAIRAFALLKKYVPSIELKIAGSEYNREYAQSLNKLIKELELEDVVHLLGTRKDIPELLANASAFILCSENDAFPRSVLEAMVMGTPVIAANIPGSREAVQNEINGLLVEVGDIKGYTKALMRVLQDKNFSNRMTETARKTIETKFNAQRMVAELTEVYQLIAKRR